MKAGVGNPWRGVIGQRSAAPRFPPVPGRRLLARRPGKVEVKTGWVRSVLLHWTILFAGCPSQRSKIALIGVNTGDCLCATQPFADNGQGEILACSRLKAGRCNALILLVDHRSHRGSDWRQQHHGGQNKSRRFIHCLQSPAQSQSPHRSPSRRLSDHPRTGRCTCRKERSSGNRGEW